MAGEDSGHLAVVQGKGHFRMSAYEEIGRSVASNTVPDDDKCMSDMQTACDIHMAQLYVLDAAKDIPENQQGEPRVALCRRSIF